MRQYSIRGTSNGMFEEIEGKENKERKYHRERHGINVNKSIMTVLTFQGVEGGAFAVLVVQYKSSQEVEHFADHGTPVHEVAQCRGV